MSSKVGLLIKTVLITVVVVQVANLALAFYWFQGLTAVKAPEAFTGTEAVTVYVFDVPPDVQVPRPLQPASAPQTETVENSEGAEAEASGEVPPQKPGLTMERIEAEAVGNCREVRCEGHVDPEIKRQAEELNKECVSESIIFTSKISETVINSTEYKVFFATLEDRETWTKEMLEISSLYERQAIDVCEGRSETEPKEGD